MFSSGFDGIALALAVAGVGLGGIGIGRDSNKALSLIGAALGLFGASWLLFRVLAGNAPSVELPGIASVPQEKASISIAATLYLAFHAMIVFIVCLADFGSTIDQRSTKRFWVAAPILCALAVLPLAPIELALLYLTASVFVGSLAGNGDPGFRVSKSIGALAFVAAVLMSTVEAGTAVLQFQLSREDVTFAMLAIAVVVPLLSPPTNRYGGVQTLYSITASFWLFAVVVVQIGVAPFSVRLSAVLAFTTASLAAWRGWRSVNSRNPSDQRRSIFLMLQALTVFQWVTSASINSTLGVWAAFTFACLAFELLNERIRAQWINSGVFGVTAFGLALSSGSIVTHSIEHAMPLGASIAWIVAWSSLALVLVSIGFLSSILFAHFRDGSSAKEPERAPGQAFEVVTAAAITALAGCFSMRPNVFGALTSTKTAPHRFFDFTSVSIAPAFSPTTLAFGLALTSLSVAVGARLIPSRTLTESSNVGRPFVFWRVIAFPFLIVERFTEALLDAVFRVRFLRNGGADVAPSPAVIVALVAAACSVVLLAVQRGASP